MPVCQIYVSSDDYFYSNDNPIIIERTDYDNTEYIDMGLNSYGVVVSFPLTKKILVRKAPSLLLYTTYLNNSLWLPSRTSSMTSLFLSYHISRKSPLM